MTRLFASSLFVFTALITSPAAADQCMCLGATGAGSTSAAPWTGPHDWDRSSPAAEDAVSEDAVSDDAVSDALSLEVGFTAAPAPKWETVVLPRAKRPTKGSMELSSPPEIMSYVIARDLPTDEDAVLWCEGGDDPRCVPALPTTDGPSDLTPPTVSSREALDETSEVTFTHGFVRERGPSIEARERLERPPR